jgi:Ca2+-binding EF-hand superfamily protein
MTTDTKSSIQASEIKEIFMLFDKNSDGYVSVKDLGTLVRAINLNPTETEIVEMMRKVDPTNSGQFNLNSLEQMVRSRGADNDTLSDIVDALRVFDTDNDGKITVGEFRYAMINMGERMDEAEVDEIIADS